jgi:predicted RNA-binding Zn ribbon-like protein
MTYGGQHEAVRPQEVMPMPWPATSRYALASAPGALGLAQDLLNTAPAGHEPDLLADLASARTWVSEATAQWSAATGLPVPEVVLDAGDLRMLRAFRDDLREVTAAEHDGALDSGPAAPVLHTGAAALQLGADGSVRLHPQETGPQALVMLVLAALLEGQQAGTGRRLKTCRNPRCRVAFYDRSRNASGVWHSVRICGNAINLRAHRERRRSQDQP